ncbi:MAG: HNH endonuclease [Stenotrophomonas sp.]
MIAKDADLISREDLMKELFYCPSSGHFTWLRRSGARNIGQRAGNTNFHGYIRIQVRGRSFLAHRLAWLIGHGEWPNGEIDHLNGDRLDNRLCNLRDGSHSANNQNKRIPQRNNRSGYLGVFPHNGGWTAAISVNRKNHYLGTFADPKEAHAAYLAAKARLHPFSEITK